MQFFEITENIRRLEGSKRSKTKNELCRSFFENRLAFLLENVSMSQNVKIQRFPIFHVLMQ